MNEQALHFTIAGVFKFKWVNMLAIISEGGVWYTLPFIFLILGINLDDNMLSLVPQ